MLTRLLIDLYRVQLKASIVVPTGTGADGSSDSILYSAFIEPRAASTLGGGCGQAYIFVGSRTTIAGKFLRGFISLLPVTR
jgi:hypothetical protein